MLTLLLSMASAQTAPPMYWEACTWTDAPFEKEAKIRPAGVRDPVATVRGHGMVSVTGALGQDMAGRMAFSAVYARNGVSVAGSARPRDNRLFRLSGEGAVDVGSAGKLVVGGMLDVVGFANDKVLVTANAWARDDLKRGPGHAKVSCNRLSVTRGPRLNDEGKLVTAVFGEHRSLRLRRKHTLKLRDRPDGRVVLKLRPVDWLRKVWVVEEGEGWWHVAIPHWTGVVWHGWVDSLPEADPEAGQGGVLGGLGMSGGGEPIPILSCPEPQVLWAVTGVHAVPLGSVDAGTELLVVEDAGSTVGVLIDAGWVFPEQGWHFEVRGATACERSARERPPAKGLEDVLGELETAEPENGESGESGDESGVVP